MEVNIKPQVTQQTFQMKWTQRKVEQKTLTQILLANKKRLEIRQTQDWKLQTLYSEAGEWIKSKLKFFKGNKILRSVNNVSMD